MRARTRLAVHSPLAKPNASGPRWSARSRSRNWAGLSLGGRPVRLAWRSPHTPDCSSSCAQRLTDCRWTPTARATWDWLSPCRSNRAASIRRASNAAKSRRTPAGLPMRYTLTESRDPCHYLMQGSISLVNFFRGNWAGALLHARASCRAEPGSSIEGFGKGTLFRQMAYAGDHDGARAIFDEQRAWLPRSGQPNTIGSWLMLASVIEGLVMLGEQAQAAQLYPLAGELVGTGAVTLWAMSRFTQTIAGIAAAAARQWDAAEEHFQIAMQQAESFPNLLEHAEI